MVKRVQYSGHCLLLLFFIDWVFNYQITLSIIIYSQYYAICRHLRIHSAKNIWWCLTFVGVYIKSLIGDNSGQNEQRPPYCTLKISLILTMSLYVAQELWDYFHDFPV